MAFTYDQFGNLIEIPNFTTGGTKSNLKDWFRQAKSNTWSKSSGIKGLGKLANVGMGISQGVQGISNFNNLMNADSDLDSLQSQVKLSAMNNPLYASYLDANQKNALRKVQAGSYDSGSGLSSGLESGAKAIPQALLKALGGFAIGGIPGALISGIGTVANAGLQGAAQGKEQKAAELASLYDTLSSAEQDYNAMRRPYGLSYANLQNRYSSLLR